MSRERSVSNLKIHKMSSHSKTSQILRYCLMGEGDQFMKEMKTIGGGPRKQKLDSCAQ